MENLKVIGKEEVAGYEFTGIEGGFGDGTRGMLVRDIAEIHKRPTAVTVKALDINYSQEIYISIIARNEVNENE